LGINNSDYNNYHYAMDSWILRATH